MMKKRNVMLFALAMFSCAATGVKGMEDVGVVYYDVTLESGPKFQFSIDSSGLLDLKGKGITTRDLNTILRAIIERGDCGLVRMLFLAGNQLSELPPQIGKLVKLKGLSLRGNQLSELPPQIGELVNLKGLDVSYNRLTGLPATIGELTNLKKLWVSSYVDLTNINPEIVSVCLESPEEEAGSGPAQVFAFRSFLRYVYRQLTRGNCFNQI